MTAWVVLLQALACSPERSSAAEVTRAAASGEPGNLTRCLELETQAWGACVFAGVSVAPLAEVAGVCAQLEAPRDRGECWFAVAERGLVEIGKHGVDAASGFDGVVSACAKAAPFEVDCARHAWHAVRVADPSRADALLAQLRTAMPRHAADLADDAAWRVDQVGRADQERAALAEQAAVRGDVLRSRWTRRALRDSGVRARLCAAALEDLARSTREEPLFARLVWERSPEADAAVMSARAEVCGADVPSGPGAGYAR